ncbi:glycosyltransferase [Patescibacteria group bacterium]|nr:glycosyltransferase [Patescibacteria group bacterium]
MSKVDAIIPAYNESKTIGGVIKVLKASEHIGKVVVISDGSTDNTEEVAKQAGADLVHQLPVKKGKGAAMMHGVTHTDSNVIAFFDADLKGLTTDHVELIVLPVLTGARMMNVGLRDRGYFGTAMMHHLPLIGGERAMMRHVFEDIPDQFMQGFMVEAALNYYCRSHGYAYGGVKLPGLKIVKKYQKVGWPKAIGEYASMSWVVYQAMIKVRFAHLRGKFWK